MSPEIAPLAGLPLDRKLKLLDELWGVIADDPALAEVPDWHREILTARTMEFEQNPNAVIAWKDLRKELLDRLP